MKNYRLLIAVAITAMMVLSIYQLFSGAMKATEELNDYVHDAKTLAEDGLVGKAVEKYTSAINLKSDIKYYITVMDLYYEHGEIENCIAWGEETIHTFPKNPIGYERLIKAYIAKESYKEAYETLDIAAGQKVTSQEIEKYRSEMKYLYFLSYISIQDVAQNSGGYFVVQKKDKWGVLDARAKTVIKPIYQDIGAFVNGMAAVYDEDGCWYFAESGGQYAANLSKHIEGTISDVGVYTEGRFAVCVDGVYKYFTPKFEVISEGYDYAGAYNNGVAAVRRGTSWFLLDTHGARLSGEEYEDIVVDDRGFCCLLQRIVAKQNGEYILLDEKGERIGQVAFEEIKLPAGDPLIAVKRNGLWGFANLKGDIVIEPQYEDAQSFSNGLAAVCVQGKWGYINENNEMCIDPIFIKCLNMTSAGTALVLTDNNWNVLMLYRENY